MRIEELRVGQIISYSILGGGHAKWRARITKVFNPPIMGSHGELKYGERQVLIGMKGEDLKGSGLFYKFELWNVKSYALVKNIPPQEEMKPSGIKPVFKYMELLK